MTHNVSVSAQSLTTVTNTTVDSVVTVSDDAYTLCSIRTDRVQPLNGAYGYIDHKRIFILAPISYGLALRVAAARRGKFLCIA